MTTRCYIYPMDYSDHENETSLSDLLIAFLCSARSTVTYRRIIRERVLSRRKEASIRTTLSRLAKKGLVRKNSDGWEISADGKNFLPRKSQSGFISSPFPLNSPNKLLVSFDVPHSQRYTRDWL